MLTLSLQSESSSTSNEDNFSSTDLCSVQIIISTHKNSRGRRKSEKDTAATEYYGRYTEKCPSVQNFRHLFLFACFFKYEYRKKHNYIFT